ncbi:MAG: hypothetical protein V5B39_01025 [Accumulibacter sp.]
MHKNLLAAPLRGRIKGSVGDSVSTAVSVSMPAMARVLPGAS